ncbi:MAG: hypothetical protein KIT84_37795 [Labilithrix sp.]|nr:hypothetical protein [Labilithrix sp.]MCW5816811.1 hypothetical protein [Labilithrix sp.]
MRRLSLAALVMLAGCAAPRTPPPPAKRPATAAMQVPATTKPRTPPSGAIVFRAHGFPSVDAPAVDDAVLDAALAGVKWTRASTTSELVDQLRSHPYDVLVLPYGSAFPVDAWSPMREFLGGGGGLVVLGGAPFHAPIKHENGRWVAAARSTAFAHDLHVGPAEALKMPDGSTTWALTVRLTDEREFPDEHGSAGPRDAVVRSLAPVLDAAGVPRGCRLLEVDRLRGGSAGARWLFATTDRKLEAGAIKSMIERALQGATETRAIPIRASVAPGETAEIAVTASGPFKLTVTAPTGKPVFSVVRPGSGSVKIDAKLEPGLHRVVVEREAGPEPRVAESGFWVKDEKLLGSGPKINVGRDWLTKDGRPFPIVGTTYMASDVHRHFLFEPNPHVWDRDFSAMKKHGVNFVRTGLWTAWSRVMSEPTGGSGARIVDERVLAAAEAFVETAALHGIVVCFNLFAFLPPAYDGANPYLDPRSLEGQRALVSSIARRFAGVSWVHWDLINEPSYAPPAKLWRTRPIGDTHEAKAWHEWVDARHGRPSVAALQALWGDATATPLALPTDDDFEVGAMQVGRHPRKARDFRELTEDVTARWAGNLRAAIRAAAGDELVTLGQDEGGIYERATQQLLANTLDYTAVHTWWKNDDLLWGGVLTKVAGKPNLHQETGLMRLERSDGTPWRTPEDAARLLERKLGYAFASRGAGVVEWVWNVNPYMPIDEETTIGLFRPDGTAKPELDAMARFAKFFAQAAPFIEDFEPDPVVLVVPHARAFLGLPGQIDATKPVVRVLAERFGIAPSAMSDLRLAASKLEGVKLVIVPNATVLDEPAAKVLLDASRAGTKVLFTGAIEGDSYGRRAPSLDALGLLVPTRPVAMHEKTAWSPSGSVAFEELAQEKVLRADVPSLGKLTGNVWHEPLPLELTRDREALVRLLRAALEGARVPAAFAGSASGSSEAGVAGRVLLASKHALAVLVNERPEAAKRTLLVDGKRVEMTVGARGSSLAIVDRAAGHVVVTMP